MTLVIYFIWNLLILGIVPVEGVNGLLSANQKGLSAVESFRYITKSNAVYTISQFFSFFAITTSFLGVTLGLFDFISDGLKIEKKGIKKFFVALLTFLPPVLITLVNPQVFLTALNYAGGIGGSLLLVFLPTLLVWTARYIKQEKGHEQYLFGGKPLLLLIFLFSFLELVLCVYHIIN